MEQNLSKLESELKKINSDFKKISPSDVSAANWVRWKCKYGCKAYGKHFSCPPHTPSPSETKELLKEYDEAYLFRFKDIKTDSKYIEDHSDTCYSPIMEEKPNPKHLHHYFFEGVREVQEKMLKIESKAFTEGFYKAFAFAGLPCSLCEECVIEKEDLSEPISKKECKNPSSMRPPMEGSGIDVFGTARNAGYNIEILKSADESINLFGLLLLK